jgi:hypothetical protein
MMDTMEHEMNSLSPATLWNEMKYKPVEKVLGETPNQQTENEQ